MMKTQENDEEVLINKDKAPKIEIENLEMIIDIVGLKLFAILTKKPFVNMCGKTNFTNIIDTYIEDELFTIKEFLEKRMKIFHRGVNLDSSEYLEPYMSCTIQEIIFIAEGIINRFHAQSNPYKKETLC